MLALCLCSNVGRGVSRELLGVRVPRVHLHDRRVVHDGRCVRNRDDPATARQDETHLEDERPPPVTPNAPVCECGDLKPEIWIGGVTANSESTTCSERCQQQNGRGLNRSYHSRRSVER